MQPVMQPVFNTLPAGDILLRTAQEGGRSAGASSPRRPTRRTSRRRWQALAAEQGEGDRAGVLARCTAARRRLLRNRRRRRRSLARRERAGSTYTRPRSKGTGASSSSPIRTAMLHDGRGANKPWLLENADPVTKITWHSWVEVSPETARRLDVRDGEILRLTSPHGTIEAPVYIYPGSSRTSSPCRSASATPSTERSPRAAG